MSVAYKIEKNVPIPSGARRPKGELRLALEALNEAEVGDSVFLPKLKTLQITSRCYQIGGKGWYRARAVEGGVRVWKKA